jgi:hypothetical protein
VTAVEYVGSVSSEGGPLLVADALTVAKWRGVEDGGADYDRACRVSSPGGSLAMGGSMGIIWDLGGPGTAGVLREGFSGLVICRAWLSVTTVAEGRATIARFAEIPLVPQRRMLLGRIHVASGALVVLWATESGRSVRSSEVPGQRMGKAFASVEGSMLAIAMPSGMYTCWHDQVELPVGEARRCIVTME